MAAPSPTTSDSVERRHPGRIATVERFVAARLDPKAYLGLHVTISLGIAALALWAFGALLEEVLENATVVRLDVATMAWVDSHVTPLGLRVFGIITRLGDSPVIPLIGVVGAFVLWRERRRLLLACWMSAFVGGVLFNKLLKLLVHRDRPVLPAGRSPFTEFSFPSGHAMAATVGYGMLAYVLAVYWRPRRIRRRFIGLGAASIALLVGVSRVYLGAHFPTDVLGGFAAGAAWLAICVTGTRIARETPAAVPEALDPERVKGHRAGDA